MKQVNHRSLSDLNRANRHRFIRRSSTDAGAQQILSKIDALEDELSRVGANSARGKAILAEMEKLDKQLSAMGLEYQ